MKNLKFLAGALTLAAMFVSCKDQDDVAQEAAIKTTDVSLLMLPGEAEARGALPGSVPVKRPSTVLDFVNDITVTATHVGSISNPYSVSETYTMVDKGNGNSDFVLKDVALGKNTFTAFADTYAVDESDPVQGFHYEFVSGKIKDLMSQMRSAAPHTTFSDAVDVDIFEGINNSVHFEMAPSSGRLMTLIKLSDDMVSKFNTNAVKVTATWYDYATNQVGSQELAFTKDNYDEVLKFYWSHNELTATGAKVVFDFAISDDNLVVSNQFYTEFDIITGESLGCILIVDEDSVVEDVSNFKFNFDWEEVDCDDCGSDKED